jgi:hypothetical protein
MLVPRETLGYPRIQGDCPPDSRVRCAAAGLLANCLEATELRSSRLALALDAARQPGPVPQGAPRRRSQNSRIPGVTLPGSGNARPSALRHTHLPPDWGPGERS